MIRHAPEAAAFSGRPVAGPGDRAAPPRLCWCRRLASRVCCRRFFLPASLAAIPVAPVAMAADPERRPAANTPANPPAQELLAGPPHTRPIGGRGQPRPVRAISIPSTDDAEPFFRAGAKKPDRRLTAKVFPSRLRPHPARASESLTDDEESTSLYRLSPKKPRP